MSDIRDPASDSLLDAQYAASGTIYGSTDPAEMLGAILDFAAVPYAYAHLALLRNPTSTPAAETILDIVAEAERGSPAAANSQRSLADYPAYDTLTAVELIHIEDVQRDPFLNDDERTRLNQRSVRSMFVIPLVAQQSLIGVVEVEQQTHAPLPAPRLRALRRLADQAAVVLQNQALLRAAQANAEALRNQVTALQTLNQLAVEVGRFTDEQTLLDFVTRTAAQALRVDHAGLVAIDNDKLGGTVVSEWPQTTVIGSRFDFRGNEMFDLFLGQLPVPLRMDNVMADTRVTDQTKQVFSRIGIASVMMLPVMVRGELIASLGLDLYTADRQFTDDDVALAQTISAQMSVALQNIRLLTDAERRAEQLQRIASFSRSVQATLELPNIVRIMLTETAQMLTFDRMQIALFDPNAGGMRFIGRYENDLPTVNADAAVDLAAGGSLAGAVWKQQKFIYHPDMLELAGKRSLHDIGLRSAMGAPVRLRGRTMGAVVVGSFKANRYSDTDAALFQQLVTQFAVSVENAEAYEQSQRTARSEALVNEITLELQRSTDLTRMAEIALRRLSSQLGAGQARIRLNPVESGVAERGSLARFVGTSAASPAEAAHEDGAHENW